MGSESLTAVLQAAADGDLAARDRLYEAVYGELRRLARVQLSKGSRGDLNTTEVVHEAYLKMFDRGQIRANDRQHFFALSSRVMRQILVDHFRASAAQRRGGANQPVTLDRDPKARGADGGELILAVHEALARLEELHPRLAAVVEYRFFGGWSQSEIAEALDVTRKTVGRDWRAARAWLANTLEKRTAEQPEN